MFDVGFWELVILFGLGLVFLGPERLPKVAIQVGTWAGQARRMARNLSRQINAEINDLDITEPFSATPSSETTAEYSRPGVDDLKPSAGADDSPADEEPPAQPPEQSANKSANPSTHSDEATANKAS